MEQGYEQTRLDALVARIFSIEDITTGNPERDFIAKYRGLLRSEDTEDAYNQLAAQLEPLNITPLFRWEEDRHSIILLPGKPRPKPSNPAVNLVMFILTLMSVMFVGGLYGMTEMPDTISGMILEIIVRGWPFAVSLLAILGAHELGHYFVGRHHGVHVTLPYFIPVPMPPFGTMGAVINMKEQPKNRRHLLDIALAGPFAGLVVAIPVLILGLSLSTLDPIPRQLPPGTASMMEGNSILYLFLKYMMFGQLLPSPPSYEGLSPLVYWIQFFFTGRPVPFGGMDVMLHPVALAGWGGILVTALNLIPAGQLDGGHISYVLIGRRNALRLLPLILGILAVLGVFWVGWWLWVALIFFLGRAHAEPLDQITPLDSRRRMLAVLAIIVFFLVFTPVPLNIIGSV
jgi:membrane-associated protease RseP (regulator of RpoE activity)